jgi:hypothetical protein
MAFHGEDMAPTWQCLTATFKDPNTDAEARGRMYAALMDMGLIDQMRGNPERGLTFQAQALAACRLFRVPAALPPRLTVLGFVMAGKINANTPVEFLLQDSDVTLHLLYVVPGLPLPPVPAHDLAFVLVSESDEARPVLRELERLTHDWPRPVLNRPDLVPQFGRECLYRRLAHIPGLETTATVRVGRSALEAVARRQREVGSLLPGGGFPLIVRPLDSHAGDGLEKIDSAAEAASYLAEHAEAEFHLARFMDYRSADGLYRKYRVAVIDAEPFPVHMAASDHWMIHYLNAGMLESASKRAEEARFMDRFPEDFGRRHGPAITAMAETLGLDYFGFDCGETPDGNLLIFEAGTALVVHDMDGPALFSYKVPHMQAVFRAFRALLGRRASFI